jgi:DnaK suppressor protein
MLMPDYTTTREDLEDKLGQLVARAGDIDHDLRETPDEDWEERATELENDEVLSAVGNLTLNEIGQIKHALHRIDSGSYGTCEHCGTSIPNERLEALPYAITCTSCT